MFEELGLKARGVTAWRSGHLDEGKEIMEETSDDDARDSGMIAAARRSSIRDHPLRHDDHLGERLGLDKARKLLAETLEQEKAADGKLTRLAERSLNKKAA